MRIKQMLSGAVYLLVLGFTGAVLAVGPAVIDAADAEPLPEHPFGQPYEQQYERQYEQPLVHAFEPQFEGQIEQQPFEQPVEESSEQLIEPAFEQPSERPEKQFVDSTESCELNDSPETTEQPMELAESTEEADRASIVYALEGVSSEYATDEVIAVPEAGRSELAADAGRRQAGATREINLSRYSAYGGNSARLTQRDRDYLLKLSKCGPEIAFGGWVEGGIYVNSHGANDNGPNKNAWIRPNDATMSQMWLFGEKVANGKNGVDWGFRADFVYGMAGPGLQSGDEDFDYGWGDDKYGAALPQIFGTLACENVLLKFGRFTTPIGWEGTASANNFFYSHSNLYYIEPSTHSGFLADFSLGQRITLSAGWVAGSDNWLSNRYGDSGFLGGLSFEFCNDMSIYYYCYAGTADNGFHKDGSLRFRNNVWREENFIQSLCFEWTLNKRWYYMFQYDLDNTNVKEFGDTRHRSSHGFNQHLIYTINECWKLGFRAEWFKDNGGYITDDASEYIQLTLGLNWNPCSRLSVRPEVRYDKASNGSPFGKATAPKSEQISGGLGVVIWF